VTQTVTFWLLALVALAGAATVVFSADALRLVVGLGAFLLAVAGFYLFYGMGFLAAAQVFVYVGGVLVLVLFALMLLSRDVAGRLLAPVRFDLSAAAVATALFILLSATLRDAVPLTADKAPIDLAGTLLGPMLPAFEILGVLLLTGLVAALAIVGGGGER
jgi:NADH:ubiquinone oxidoreductase subunit 6 (subunit J)